MGTCYADEEGCLVQTSQHDDANQHGESRAKRRDAEHTTDAPEQADAQSGAAGRVEVEYANWPVEVLDIPGGATSVANFDGQQVVLPPDLASQLQLPPGHQVSLPRLAPLRWMTGFHVVEGETETVSVDLTRFMQSALTLQKGLLAIQNDTVPGLDGGLAGLGEAMREHVDHGLNQLGQVWASVAIGEHIRQADGGQPHRMAADNETQKELVDRKGDLSTAMGDQKNSEVTRTLVDTRVESLVNALLEAMAEVSKAESQRDELQIQLELRDAEAELSSIDAEIAEREAMFTDAADVLLELGVGTATGGPVNGLKSGGKKLLSIGLKRAAKWGAAKMSEKVRANATQVVDTLRAKLDDQQWRTAMLRVDSAQIRVSALSAERDALIEALTTVDELVARRDSAVGDAMKGLALHDESATGDENARKGEWSTGPFIVLSEAYRFLQDTTPALAARFEAYHDYLEFGDWTVAFHQEVDAAYAIQAQLGDLSAEGLSDVMRQIQQTSKFFTETDAWLDAEASYVGDWMAYAGDRRAMDAAAILAAQTATVIDDSRHGGQGS